MDTVTTLEGGQRKHTSVIKTLTIMLADIVNYRELIWQIYLRDFLNANKKSFFGFAWYLIGPFIAALSWIFMNMAGVIRSTNLDIPYPVFVLVGSSLWGLFSSLFFMCGQTINGGRGFINQVSYPHHVMAVKQIFHALSLFFIGFLFNVGVITLMGYPPSLGVLWLPVLIIPYVLLAGGLGLVLSVFFVVGDIERFVGALFGLLVYMMPVYYSMRSPEEGGFLYTINIYNPLTYLIVYVRDMVLYGHSPFLHQYLIVSGASVLICLVCIRVFYITEMLVIERMN